MSQHAGNGNDRLRLFDGQTIQYRVATRAGDALVSLDERVWGSRSYVDSKQVSQSTAHGNDEDADVSRLLDAEQPEERVECSEVYIDGKGSKRQPNRTRVRWRKQRDRAEHQPEDEPTTSISRSSGSEEHQTEQAPIDSFAFANASKNTASYNASFAAAIVPLLSEAKVQERPLQLQPFSEGDAEEEGEGDLPIHFQGQEVREESVQI